MGSGGVRRYRRKSVLQRWSKTSLATNRRRSRAHRRVFCVSPALLSEAPAPERPSSNVSQREPAEPAEPADEVAEEALHAIAQHPEKAEAVQARGLLSSHFGPGRGGGGQKAPSQAVMNASLSPGLTTLSELMDVLKALTVTVTTTGSRPSMFPLRTSRRCQGVPLSTCWWQTSRRSWPT